MKKAMLGKHRGLYTHIGGEFKPFLQVQKTTNKKVMSKLKF